MAADIDFFLKKLISLAEGIENTFMERTRTHERQFNEYYEKFNDNVEQFLRDSTQLIAHSTPMMDYKRFHSREFERNQEHLIKEISLFNHKKQQATSIENLFRKIKIDYDKTSLPLMRDIIDANMSDKETVYNSKNGMHMLTNYLSKLEGELRNDQRLRDNSIIKDFKVLKRARNPVQKPGSVNPAAGNHGNLNSSNLRDFGRNPENQRTIFQHIPSDAYHTTEGISQDWHEITLQRPLTTIKSNFEQVIQLPKISKITCLRTVDLNRLAIGTEEGLLYVYNIGLDSSSKLQFSLDLGSQINSLEVIEKPNYLNIHSDTIIACALAKPLCQVVLLFLDHGQVTKSILHGHKDSVREILEFRHGNFLTCSDDGNIALWQGDGKASSPLTIFKAHLSKINDIALIDNKNLLLSAGDDHLIGIKNMSTDGNIVKEEPLKDVCEVKIVRGFENNASFAFTAGSDWNIKIWNIKKRL